MGILDKLKAKKDEDKDKEHADVPEGKYDEPCSLCGQLGTEKKWMGQYWHKKCMRKSRKFARGMV